MNSGNESKKRRANPPGLPTRLKRTKTGDEATSTKLATASVNGTIPLVKKKGGFTRKYFQGHVSKCFLSSSKNEIAEHTKNIVDELNKIVDKTSTMALYCAANMSWNYLELGAVATKIFFFLKNCDDLDSALFYELNESGNLPTVIDDQDELETAYDKLKEEVNAKFSIEQRRKMPAWSTLCAQYKAAAKCASAMKGFGVVNTFKEYERFFTQHGATSLKAMLQLVEKQRRIWMETTMAEEAREKAQPKIDKILSLKTKALQEIEAQINALPNEGADDQLGKFVSEKQKVENHYDEKIQEENKKLEAKLKEIRAQVAAKLKGKLDKMALSADKRREKDTLQMAERRKKEENDKLAAAQSEERWWIPVQIGMKLIHFEFERRTPISTIQSEIKKHDSVKATELDFVMVDKDNREHPLESTAILEDTELKNTECFKTGKGGHRLSYKVTFPRVRVVEKLAAPADTSVQEIYFWDEKNSDGLLMKAQPTDTVEALLLAYTKKQHPEKKHEEFAFLLLKDSMELPLRLEDTVAAAGLKDDKEGGPIRIKVVTKPTSHDAPPSTNTTMTLTVQNFTRKEDITFEAGCTVLYVKERIAERLENCPIHQQRLLLKGKELLDNASLLLDCGIIDGSLLHLVRKFDQTEEEKSEQAAQQEAARQAKVQEEAAAAQKAAADAEEEQRKAEAKRKEEEAAQKAEAAKAEAQRAAAAEEEQRKAEAKRKLDEEAAEAQKAEAAKAEAQRAAAAQAEEADKAQRKEEEAQRAKVTEAQEAAAKASQIAEAQRKAEAEKAAQAAAEQDQKEKEKKANESAQATGEEKEKAKGGNEEEVEYDWWNDFYGPIIDGLGSLSDVTTPENESFEYCNSFFLCLVATILFFQSKFGKHHGHMKSLLGAFSSENVMKTPWDLSALPKKEMIALVKRHTGIALESAVATMMITSAKLLVEKYVGCVPPIMPALKQLTSKSGSKNRAQTDHDVPAKLMMRFIYGSGELDIPLLGFSLKKPESDSE